MSEYESLKKRELVKIIRSLLKEELSPIEYLFQYYTKQGYYFNVEQEKNPFHETWECLSISAEEEPSRHSLESTEEITEDRIPEFMRCITLLLEE